VKVVWSPRSVERAYEQARYIAKDKPEAALRWLDGLFESTDRLAEFPDSGRIVAEIGLPQFREIIYKSHRVIYLRESNRISVLTVRRSKQRLDPEVLVGE
jgi:plasmid stabilization system protein ParE